MAVKKASCPEMIFGQLAFYKKYYSFEFELEELLVLSPGLLLLELSLLLELVVSLLDDDLFSPSEALAAVAALSRCPKASDGQSRRNQSP